MLKISIFLMLMLAASGLFPFQAQAVVTLSDGELDGINAGLLDAKAKITANAAANSTCLDGAQCWSNTTGGGTGVASVPVYNGQIIKNDTAGGGVPGGTVPGQGETGGSVAAAHNVGSVAVSTADNSINTDIVNLTQVGGDQAVAHGAGATAIVQGIPQGGRKRSDKPEENEFFGGNESSTDFLFGRSGAQGHGNSSSVKEANKDGEVSTEKEVNLTDEVQESNKAMNLTNALAEVGHGVNTASNLNGQQASLILNGTSGAIALKQGVYNFSGTTTNAGTVSISSISGTKLGTGSNTAGFRFDQ